MSKLEAHDASLQEHRNRTEGILEELQDDVHELKATYIFLKWWREFREDLDRFLHDFSGCYEEIRRIRMEGKKPQHLDVAKITDAWDRSQTSSHTIISHAESFRTECVMESESKQRKSGGKDMDKDMAWLDKFVGDLQESNQRIQRALDESDLEELFEAISDHRTRVEGVLASVDVRVKSIAGRMGDIAGRLGVACEVMMRGVKDGL